MKLLVVLLFILFEEIAWKRIGEPVHNIISSLKIMNRFKLYISDIKHRYILLGIFIIPFVLMEITSIYAGASLLSGAIIMGIGLYMIKLFLTIPVVIIFNIGKDILISFWLIKYGYGMILRFKRSNAFRSVKKFTKKLKKEWSVFKEEYLNVEDGDFVESIKKMYQVLKKVD
jgi:hypothetical protein